MEVDGRPEVFKIVRLVVAPPPAASLARSELVHMWPGYAPTSNLSATSSNTTIVTERGAKRVTNTITTSTVSTAADGGTKITTTTSVEARDAAQLLAFTRPPPTDIGVGVPFRVSLHMSTETGWPLAGEAVQAMLLTITLTLPLTPTLTLTLALALTLTLTATTAHYGGEDT